MISSLTGNTRWANIGRTLWCRQERDDLLRELGAAQLRENIGVEQPACYSPASRTGNRARLGSMPSSRCGEAWRAATSAAPLRSPCRRRTSSAAMTTISSRPWTVTCCGPSACTRLTSSLNRAFASCRSQRLGRGSRGRRRALRAFGVFAFVNLVILNWINRGAAQYQATTMDQILKRVALIRATT